MQTGHAVRRRIACTVAFNTGLLLAVAAVALPAGAASDAAPNALLTIDQNRTTVVDRIVTTWGDALAATGAGLTKDQLQALLTGLRSDQLLAASLAGSLDGLRNVIANALTANAPVVKGLIQTKALGDAGDDLVYTPVTPCREVDTRNAGGPLGTNSSRDFKVWVSSGGFTAQGGSATNCNIPANPAAVVVNIAAVGPAGAGNFIAYPTGTPSVTSVLNYQSGEAALSNGAIVPACVPNCTNQLTIAVNGAGADVVIDIVGYFRAPGGGNVAITGNITLSESTSASVGNVFKGANPFLHNFGPFNTFAGEIAGNFTMTGGDNVAFGYGALNANTSGASNTAAGVEALFNNSTGYANTAIGDAALLYNTSGIQNTAVGYTALYSNDNGQDNTSIGQNALFANTSGGANTAVGGNALNNNTGGSGNIAVGYGAGKFATGNYNIDIGSPGAAAEDLTIRIGGIQSRAFIQGVWGALTRVGNAIPVVIDSNGQLGTFNSSRRFKDDIADMHDASSSLMQLRPVTFHYKTDQNPSGRTLQYGLVAEEVAEVYPGLVAYSADGQIETVMYQFLPPMLLNEYQKQQRMIEAQAAEVSKQAAVIANQTAEIAMLQQDRHEQTTRIAELEKQAAEIAMLKQQVAQMIAAQAQSARFAGAGK